MGVEIGKLIKKYCDLYLLRLRYTIYGYPIHCEGGRSSDSRSIQSILCLSNDMSLPSFANYLEYKGRVPGTKPSNGPTNATLWVSGRNFDSSLKIDFVLTRSIRIGKEH